MKTMGVKHWLELHDPKIISTERLLMTSIITYRIDYSRLIYRLICRLHCYSVGNLGCLLSLFFIGCSLLDFFYCFSRWLLFHLLPFIPPFISLAVKNACNPEYWDNSLLGLFSPNLLVYMKPPGRAAVPLAVKQCPHANEWPLNVKIDVHRDFTLLTPLSLPFQTTPFRYSMKLL